MEEDHFFHLDRRSRRNIDLSGFEVPLMRTNIDDLVRLAEIAKKKDRGTRNAILLSALRPDKAEKVAKILTLSAVPSIVANRKTHSGKSLRKRKSLKEK